MPPKKSKATAGDGSEAGGEKGRFRWTPELDLKLLTCIVTPRTVSKEEHDILAKKLGVPTAGGVRNRIDKLKGDFKAAREELEGGAGDGAAAMTPKKADADKPKSPKKRPAKAMKDDEAIQDEHNTEEPGQSKKKAKNKVKKEESLEPEGLLDTVPSE